MMTYECHLAWQQNTLKVLIILWVNQYIYVSESIS